MKSNRKKFDVRKVIKKIEILLLKNLSVSWVFWVPMLFLTKKNLGCVWVFWVLSGKVGFIF